MILQKLEMISDTIDYGITASAGKSGAKFLRITDIQDNNVNWNTVPYCQCNNLELGKYKLSSGDIVFARTGATTGKSYLIDECPEETVFASYLIRVKPNKDAIYPKYLAYFFHTPSYWSQITSAASGSTQPGVNSTKIMLKNYISQIK